MIVIAWEGLKMVRVDQALLNHTETFVNEIKRFSEVHITCDTSVLTKTIICKYSTLQGYICLLSNSNPIFMLNSLAKDPLENFLQSVMDAVRDGSNDKYSFIGDKGNIGFMDFENCKYLCSYNSSEESQLVNISAPFRSFV